MIKKAYCKSNVFIHIFTGRTASNKVLHDKLLILRKIQNTMNMKDVLLLWFITVLMKILLLHTKDKKLILKTSN